MIPLLNPLKEKIWLLVAGSIITVSGLGVGIFFVANSFFNDNIFIALALVAVLIFILALVIGRYVAMKAVKPTDYLAKSILTVTNAENAIDPPNPDKLDKPSKEFIASLMQKVYGFNSSISQKNDDEHSDLSYYQAITNLYPLPIIAINTEQHIGFMNDSALSYLELKAEDIADKPLYDVFNISFTSTETLEKWLKSIAGNTVNATETWQRVKLTLADNSAKKFDLVAHYSQNNSNGLEVVLAIYDRTQLYERDDRDLTFVALAVHELRTPVTILRGYIELFSEELEPKLDAEQKSFMHNMSASAQQLTSFVSNILNVARIEENALNLNLKEENWNDVLGQVCKDMELRAKVHGKKLIIKIEPDLPTVAADRVSVYEVVANIIENAIKYTHTDEEIIIDSHLKDGLIETTVTDKGVGIPSNVVGHVFDKFYRSHSSKNSVGGTGLGLFLSKAIVEAHGGQIWVKSKEKEGSTFGFTIQPYVNLADELNNSENGEIVRGAHGWIKNHSLYRG
jgi:signal transduction histidine kinase